MTSVKVVVSKHIPEDLTATVCFDWFDPDNPIGSLDVLQNTKRGRRDNYGMISSTTPQQVVIPSGKDEIIAELTIIDGHAGDNYFIGVHPNKGVLEKAEFQINPTTGAADSNIITVLTPDSSESTSQGSRIEIKTSPVLTVWRTLWAELDQVSYTDYQGDTKMAELPRIDGIVTSELARACITIREYPKNDDRIVTGTESINAEDLDNSRNAPLPSANFWTVLIVGAAKYSYARNWLGVYYYYSSDGVLYQSVGVFNQTLESTLNTWNQRNPDNFILTSALPNMSRTVVLHEIGHNLGLADIVNNVDPNDDNNTQNLMNHTHTAAGMLDPENQRFTISQLQTIQSHLIPAPPQNSQTNQN